LAIVEVQPSFSFGLGQSDFSKSILGEFVLGLRSVKSAEDLSDGFFDAHFALYTRIAAFKFLWQHTLWLNK